MTDRIMVKIASVEQGFYFRTISREYRSLKSFYFTEDSLKELEKTGHVMEWDTHSFARINLSKTAEGRKIIRFVLYWLSCDCQGNVTGRKEELELYYDQFQRCLEESSKENGQVQNLLSVRVGKKPILEFQSCRNLREVTRQKTVRKKLGRFLDQNFNWTSARKIVITDDFEPYSFFFEEILESGTGICGGIILHNREDLSTAYYGIHT